MYFSLLFVKIKDYKLKPIINNDHILHVQNRLQNIVINIFESITVYLL